MSWHVYILDCSNKLYTGVNNDLEARLQKHNSGKGAAFTRAMRPCVLVWHEHSTDRSLAQKREAEIKMWPRSKKKMLVESRSEHCSDCSRE